MSLRRRFPPGVLLVLGLALWGIFRTSQQLTLDISARGYTPGPLRILFDNMALAFVWLPLVPLVVRLARRLPNPLEKPLRALLAHLAAGLVLGTAHSVCFIGLVFALSLQSGRFGLFEAMTRQTVVFALSNLALYTALVAGTRAIDVVRAARENDLRRLALEKDLASARLAALTAQLNPPFFFGALATARRLVVPKPAEATQLVLDLGELLRMSFRTEAGASVTLREELRALDLYLRVEGLRLEGRLSVKVEVPPEVLDEPVPALLLIPVAAALLSEGAERRPGPRMLAITARREPGALSLVLAEEGAGPGAASSPSTSGGRTSLAAALERLEAQYGGAASLEVASTSGGVRATLRLPVSYETKAAA